MNIKIRQKTAVDWLVNNLKSHFEHDGDLLEVVQFSFKQAKNLEKQQIIDAHIEGQLMFNNANKYYNETFK